MRTSFNFILAISYCRFVAKDNNILDLMSASMLCLLIINHPRGRYCYCHTMSMNGEVVGREGITSREEAEEGELGRGGGGGGRGRV